LSTPFIDVEISGSLGAGGSTGSSKCTVGKRVGGCGSCGGLGN